MTSNIAKDSSKATHRREGGHASGIRPLLAARWMLASSMIDRSREDHKQHQLEGTVGAATPPDTGSPETFEGEL